jgi:hypothetical protein
LTPNILCRHSGPLVVRVGASSACHCLGRLHP